MRNCRISPATKRIHSARLLKSLDRNGACRGQTLVEVALVLMTFFLLAFAIIDFSWLMFSQMNEQDAVREAGRFASTGNTNGTYTRVQSITQVLDAAAVQGNINHCTVVISSAAGGTGSAGGPGDTVTVTATCHIPMLTTGLKWFPGNHDYNFTTSSTFVNEPFPGTGS